jgi:hypothetical protein
MKFGVGNSSRKLSMSREFRKNGLAVIIHTLLKGVNQVLPTLFVVRPIDKFL